MTAPMHCAAMYTIARGNVQSPAKNVASVILGSEIFLSALDLSKIRLRTDVCACNRAKAEGEDDQRKAAR